MARPGTFERGNKAALGNKGGGGTHKPKFLTEALIAKLNEQDPKTRRKNFFKLVDKLFAIAVKGSGNAQAIKEIFDRIEGRPIQNTEGDGSAEGGVHVHVTVEGGLPDDV